MAINQNAINVEALNGIESTFYTQNLLASSTSASIVSSSFLYVKELVSTIQASIASLNRQYYKVLTIINTLFSNNGALNGLSLNSNSINANDYYTQGVLSNVILLPNYYFYRTLSVASSTLSSIIKIVFGPNTLLVTSTSISSVTKGVGKLIDPILSTSSVVLTKLLELVRTITALSVSTVTMTRVRIYYRTLSIVSTSVATLLKSVQKTLTVSVNCGIILSKLVNKILSLISTVASSLIVNAISFKNIAADRLMYAAVRFRKIFY
jgi:hypothetical protein